MTIALPLPIWKIVSSIVCMLIGGRAQYVVEIPYEESEGSRFGSCTYGGPQVTGKPCHHMVAMVKRENDEDLLVLKSMLHWWTTMHWKMQLPMTQEVRGGVAMATVKLGNSGNELVSDDLTLKYCLDWTVPRKKGHPKGNSCLKSSKEIIAMAGTRKWSAHKAKRSQYFDYCNKLGHTARKCLVRHAQDEEESTEGVAI